MLIILSLLLIFTNLHETRAQIDYAEIARQATKFWIEFNKIQQPPKLLLRFQDKHKVKQKIVKWDKSKIDPSQGPFAHVFSMADRLARGRDITNCDMQYYDEGEPIDIGDDADVLELLDLGADMTGNKRLVDIICYDGTEATTREHARALKAYNFAIMAKSETTEADKDAAERELKKTYLGGYSLSAEGVQILDTDGDKFLSKAIDIADEWGWDGKTQSVIRALPDGDKVFHSRSYVKFDAANWKIVGSFAKLAGWKSDVENNKSSLFVATSKFEFTIPSDEREGSLRDKYLGGSGGTVSQEFIDNIETVLKYRAMVKSREDLDKPDLPKIEL